MSKSITISLVVALLGVAVYAFVNYGSLPPKTDQDYVSVALAFFNASAISCLFFILYKAEKETAARFGAIIRDNISTVIVALLINLIGTAVDIVGFFS